MEPISNGKNIVREVNMAYQSGTMLPMIDKRMSSYTSECLEPFANLALRCCKDETHACPAIAEVVQVLENTFQLMPAGADHSITYLSTGHSPSLQTMAWSEILDISIPVTTPYLSGEIYSERKLLGVFEAPKPMAFLMRSML